MDVFSWEQRKLGDMCDEFQSGKSIRASEITDSGEYAVYGGNGFRGYTDTYNHDGDYALIGRQGALCGNMNFSSGKAYFTEHAVAVHGNADNDTLFLYYLLDLMNLGQYSGQSAQPGLAVNKIIQLKTKAPKLDEQRLISSFFKQLDTLITLHQRKYFSFDFNGESAKTAQNTISWEQRELSDLIEENQKPVPKPDGEYIRLGIRSHAKGTFHEVVAEGEGLDVDTMYVVEANNLIVNITFAWEEAWAITTEKDAEKLVSHRFPQYRFHHGQYPMFYQYRFRNGRMKYNLELASPGGAGRNRVLNKTEFMKIPVIIPTSYEEEKKIGDLFANLDNLITLHLLIVYIIHRIDNDVCV